MEQLLAILLAIKSASKDIHYNAKGQNFWSDHLLADKIGEGIDDFMDSINEQVYLGHHLLPPASADILDMAAEMIPSIGNIESMWKGLDKLLSEGINLLDGFASSGMFRGDNQLLDDICADFQSKRALIWRRIS